MKLKSKPTQGPIPAKPKVTMRHPAVETWNHAPPSQAGSQIWQVNLSMDVTGELVNIANYFLMPTQGDLSSDHFVLGTILIQKQPTCYLFKGPIREDTHIYLRYNHLSVDSSSRCVHMVFRGLPWPTLDGLWLDNRYAYKES